jgi:dTDP-4-dehydrorhamnose 3,5-epimerase
VGNARDFAAAAIHAAFVQDNHLRNPLKGTLRGLHYQMPPAPSSRNYLNSNAPHRGRSHHLGETTGGRDRAP